MLISFPAPNAPPTPHICLPLSHAEEVERTLITISIWTVVLAVDEVTTVDVNVEVAVNVPILNMILYCLSAPELFRIDPQMFNTTISPAEYVMLLLTIVAGAPTNTLIAMVLLGASLFSGPPPLAASIVTVSVPALVVNVMLLPAASVAVSDGESATTSLWPLTAIVPKAL